MDALHRVWSLVVKEFRQLSRDRLLMGFILIAPMLELLLMGTLVGEGVQNLPLAVVDLDRSRASRELISMLDETDELMLRSYGDSVTSAQDLMQRGEIAVILTVPPDYGERLTDPRRSVTVQIITDDSNYVVDAVAVASVETVAGEVVRDLMARHVVPQGAAVDLRFLARFNAALDDRPGAITAMLGLIVYQVTLVIAAQSFTRERELGTMEQLRITPLGRIEMILGKAAPTLLIGLVDALLMVGVIVVWFEVPVRGSLPLLVTMTIPFVLAQIGWGTLISLVSRTQQQSILFVFALAMLEVAFSGFIVPASDMPAIMQSISHFFSVQHYLVILRGVLLRGAGLAVLWPSVLALSAIAAAATLVAWLRLRMGLDADPLRQRLQALSRSRRRRGETPEDAADPEQPCPSGGPRRREAHRAGEPA